MTQQSMELTLGGDKVRVDATAPQHVVAAQTMADCMFDMYVADEPQPWTIEQFRGKSSGVISLAVVKFAIQLEKFCRANNMEQSAFDATHVIEQMAKSLPTQLRYLMRWSWEIKVTLPQLWRGVRELTVGQFFSDRGRWRPTYPVQRLDDLLFGVLSLDGNRHNPAICFRVYRYHFNRSGNCVLGGASDCIYAKEGRTIPGVITGGALRGKLRGEFMRRARQQGKKHCRQYSEMADGLRAECDAYVKRGEAMDASRRAKSGLADIKFSPVHPRRLNLDDTAMMERFFELLDAMKAAAVHQRATTTLSDLSLGAGVGVEELATSAVVTDKVKSRAKVAHTQQADTSERYVSVSRFALPQIYLGTGQNCKLFRKEDLSVLTGLPHPVYPVAQLSKHPHRAAIIKNPFIIGTFADMHDVMDATGTLWFGKSQVVATESAYQDRDNIWDGELIQLDVNVAAEIRTAVQRSPVKPNPVQEDIMVQNLTRERMERVKRVTRFWLLGEDEPKVMETEAFLQKTCYRLAPQVVDTYKRGSTQRSHYDADGVQVKVGITDVPKDRAWKNTKKS